MPKHQAEAQATDPAPCSHPVTLPWEAQALWLQHQEVASLASQQSTVSAFLVWLVQCLARKGLLPHWWVWEGSEGVKGQRGLQGRVESTGVQHSPQHVHVSLLPRPVPRVFSCLGN